MARKPKSYDNEILNMRAFYLRLLGKLWIILLSAAAGALLFGFGYYIRRAIDVKNAEYEAESTLYIYFAYNEKAGTEVDYYNAFTWNTLLKTDEIMEPVMTGLEDEGYDLTREEVEEALNADIPSDVRVMILTATHKDKSACAAISKAALNSLVNYGITNSAFEQIKILRSGDVTIEKSRNREAIAVGFGALLGFIISLLALFISISMDDEVYIPEDIERRYELPVLGVMTAKGCEEPSFLRNEMIALTCKSLQKLEKVAVFSADDKAGALLAEEGIERLKEVLGSSFNFEITQFESMPLPMNDDKTSDKLSDIEASVILVKMAKKNGAVTEHLISMLNKLSVPIKGIIITDADERFMRRYLGL